MITKTGFSTVDLEKVFVTYHQYYYVEPLNYWFEFLRVTVDLCKVLFPSSCPYPSHLCLAHLSFDRLIFIPIDVSTIVLFASFCQNFPWHTSHRPRFTSYFPYCTAPNASFDSERIGENAPNAGEPAARGGRRSARGSARSGPGPSPRRSSSPR